MQEEQINLRSFLGIKSKINEEFSFEIFPIFPVSQVAKVWETQNQFFEYFGYKNTSQSLTGSPNPAQRAVTLTSSACSQVRLLNQTQTRGGLEIICGAEPQTGLCPPAAARTRDAIKYKSQIHTHTQHAAARGCCYKEKLPGSLPS